MLHWPVKQYSHRYAYNRSTTGIAYASKHFRDGIMLRGKGAPPPPMHARVPPLLVLHCGVPPLLVLHCGSTMSRPSYKNKYGTQSWNEKECCSYTVVLHYHPYLRCYPCDAAVLYAPHLGEENQPRCFIGLFRKYFHLNKRMPPHFGNTKATRLPCVLCDFLSKC